MTNVLGLLCSYLQCPKVSEKNPANFQVANHNFLVLKAFCQKKNSLYTGEILPKGY